MKPFHSTLEMSDYTEKLSLLANKDNPSCPHGWRLTKRDRLAGGGSKADYPSNGDIRTHFETDYELPEIDRPRPFISTAHVLPCVTYNLNTK
ncbi:hypothetical protein CEXT_350031 [Caerostris extrusa]|uniref:Uncharacterized protein n=1 Tax=Caerostris extrusa TaxID=172846 RepID=A0AAV4P7L4_CAEEX|nr:hypothetical protein CEXT_350031 [Caerostris extrusa]